MRTEITEDMVGNFYYEPHSGLLFIITHDKKVMFLGSKDRGVRSIPSIMRNCQTQVEMAEPHGINFLNRMLLIGNLKDLITLSEEAISNGN